MKIHKNLYSHISITELDLQAVALATADAAGQVGELGLVCNGQYMVSHGQRVLLSEGSKYTGGHLLCLTPITELNDVLTAIAHTLLNYSCVKTSNTMVGYRNNVIRLCILQHMRYD